MPDEVVRGAGLQTMDEVHLAHWRSVLRICGGNRSEAARVLGIRRQTLQKWINRFGEYAPGESPVP